MIKKIRGEHWIGILYLALIVAGCASASVNQNKQVQSLQVLQRVDEFQNLVVDLYHDKQISPDHAVLYSKFCVSAAKVVREYPNGWQPTVKNLWVELKKNIPLDKMELKVQLAAGVLDTLLMGLK